MNLTIDVREEHIQQGCPRMANHCPVSLAARDVGLLAVHAEHDWMYWLGAGRKQFAQLPPIARVFVRAFDKRKPVDPFSFEIEIPDGEPLS